MKRILMILAIAYCSWWMLACSNSSTGPDETSIKQCIDAGGAWIVDDYGGYCSFG